MAKAPTIAAGPASSNDQHVVTEGEAASGALFFNVLTNDAKKSVLYSLDNGQPTDLLNPDQVSVAEQSSLGASIWINPDGRIGYELDPARAEGLAAGETFQDSFIYAVRLPNGSLLWQTVQVTITGTNDGPVARADAASLAEDALATGSVAANDSDLDHGAVLSFAATGQLPIGFAMANDGSWALDASHPAYQSLAAGESMQLAVAYTVTDEHGASSSSTLTLTITGTNDAPVATAAAVDAAEDGTVSGHLTASDADNGAGLTFALVGDAPTGLELAVDGSWTFDANQTEYQSLGEGEEREITVAYTVTDEQGEASNSTLTLTLTGVNDTPVATSTAAEVTEGQTASGQLFALDQDHGGQLNFAIAGETPAGFALAPDGSWTFDGGDEAYQALGAGEVRIVQVPFTATDEHGAAASSFLTIAVTGTNDAPVLTGTAATLPAGSEDAAYIVTQEQLLAGWSDPEGSPLYATGLVPANAIVAANGDGSFTIVPDANFNGALQLTYDVSDGFAASSAQAQLSVAPVNDPAIIGGTQSGSVTEATPFGPGVPTASGQLTISDPDNDPLFAEISGARTSSGYGTVTVTAAGSWEYVLDNSNASVNALNNGQALNDSFTVTTLDGTQQTISVRILGASDAVQPPPPYDTRFDPNNFDAFISGGNSSSSILGTTGNDTIVGADNNQGILGREGDDTIWGQGGNDTISGDAGNDTLYGQSGQDHLEGGTGSNVLYGGSGDDSLEGDELGAGVDQLYGGSGIDNLFGYAGNDLLIGGYGVDSLTGGLGSDTFRFLDLRDSNDTIMDFVYGTDVLDFVQIDANQNAAGDQAFGWGGTTPTAYSVWATQSGSNSVLYFDTDGNAATAEFMITLYQNNLASIAGQLQAPENFLL